MTDKHLPKVKIIAAIAANGVIGKDGEIPWRFRADLRHFRNMTLGNVIIMGRKTAASLRAPLTGRFNIVVSHHCNHGFKMPLNLTGEAIVMVNFDQALDHARKAAAIRGCDVFVIGGAQIYRLAMERADEMLLTLLDSEHDGDAFFPPWSPCDWERVTSYRLADDGGMSGLFVHLRRRDGSMRGERD